MPKRARIVPEQKSAEKLAVPKCAQLLNRAVEQGGHAALFERPAHPYTRALLASTPTVDPARRHERIRLEGELPSPLDPPPGCAFHKRCPHATALCARERPELRPFDGRAVACHHAETIGGGG